MAQFISDKIRYIIYAFTMNWARHVLLAGALGTAFLIGKYSG